MSGSERKVDINKGLKNGYYDRTSTSLIVSKPGKLLYRGYNIDDLASFSTFEETIYLLLKGKLPNKPQLSEIDQELKRNRTLPQSVLDTLQIYKNEHPMDALRGGISAMSISDSDPENMSPDSVMSKSIKMCSIVPSIVAAHYRISQGYEVIEPDTSLNLAGNFLYMLTGQKQDPRDVRLIDKDFILHAEHGSNASTFAARVCASTNADFYSSLTAAVSVLKGPKHGGAAEASIKMAKEVGSVENANNYVETVIADRGRIPGFGHPVYSDVDPRSVHLKKDARDLGERRGNPKWFEIIEAVTQSKAMKRRSRLGINPNVDLWSGAIYSLLEIPEELFVPIFAIGRIPGWALHIIEQYSTKDLLRPRLYYTGPIDLPYIPIENR